MPFKLRTIMRRFNKWDFLILVLFYASGASTLFVEGGADSNHYHPLDINDEMAVYMRRHCMQELIEFQNAVNYVDSSFPLIVTGTDTDTTTMWFKQRKTRTTSDTLLVHLEQELLDCLRKGETLLHDGDGINKYPEQLSGELYVVPRRFLAHTSSSTHREAASISPSQSSVAPASVELPGKPPSHSPSPCIKASLVISGKTATKLSTTPQPAQEQLDFETGAATEDHKSDVGTDIAFAAGVSGSIIVVGLILFFCTIRKEKVAYGGSQRDERPLLMLSLGLSPNSDSNNYFGRAPSSGTTSGKLDASDAAGNLENGSGGTNTLPPPGRLAPPQPPPPPPSSRPSAPPPPPPKATLLPPMPPKSGRPPHHRGHTSSGDGTGGNSDGTKRLKPLFWDKVLANPDHSMVWHEIRAGSFQFNEEMIESLFGCTSDDTRRNGNRGRSGNAPETYIQIIDAKKSQNLSIVLRALNVTTEEVSDALLEGNELPIELLQTMVRMHPTQEEELKLRLYDSDVSRLGPAERFLKVLVNIPFVFKRMEALMFMMNMKEEVSTLKESFAAIEVACNEIKKSRLFLKLLEAVLKTGNRMNDGTFHGDAKAFKLDTLLKLSDVKGTDGKTTLLHFVVQEIVRTEGIRAARAAKQNRSISNLKSSDDSVEQPAVDTVEHYHTLGLHVVSGLSSELENVKRAANVDADTLTSTVSKLGKSLLKSKDFLNNEMKNLEEKDRFYEVLTDFVERSEGEITWLLQEEERISELVKKTADYFHGNAGKEEGQRLFSIVRDFLILLDRTCGQLKNSMTKQAPSTSKDKPIKTPSPEATQHAVHDMRQKLFPAIVGRRALGSDSSSDDDDDESSSP